MTTETQFAMLGTVFERPAIASAWARTLGRMVTRDSPLHIDDYFDKLPTGGECTTRKVVNYVVDGIIHKSDQKTAIRKWNARAVNWSNPMWWILVTLDSDSKDDRRIVVIQGSENEISKAPKVGPLTLLIPVFASALKDAITLAEALTATKLARKLKVPQELATPYGASIASETNSHDDALQAAFTARDAWRSKYQETVDAWNNTNNTKGKVETMKIKTQQMLSSVGKSLKFTATHQGGNAGLAALKALTLKLLPIKWGFWARLTGKHKAVCNHPLTTLAVAAGINIVAQHTLKEDNRTLIATQALQDAAMADAVANIGELRKVVETLLEPMSETRATDE